MLQTTATQTSCPPCPAQPARELEKALQLAADQGLPVFTLPAGRVELWPAQEDSSRPALTLRGARDFTLDASGAQLIVHGTRPGLWLEGCQGVTVRGLSLDWARPPFSIGRVLNATAQSFEFETQPGYPLEEGMDVLAINQYDPQTAAPAAGGLDCYYQVQSVQVTGPHRMRVELKTPQPIQAGMLLVLRHQVYGHDALTLHGCTDVRLEEVTIHTSPGIGVYAVDSRDITLERCAVEPPLGSGRLMSTTADATHFLNCSGTITMRGCRLIASGDDATNVHTMYLPIQTRLDDYTVVAQGTKPHLYPLLIEPGDRLEPTRRGTLEAAPCLEVRGVELLPSEQQYKLSFTQPVPQDIEPGDLLANVSRSPRVHIEDCTVARIRGRGLVIQTRDVLIQGNRFDHCQAGGVLVTTFFGDWHEALTTQNVTIRANRFSDGNQGAGACEGEISISAYLENWLYGRSGLHRELVIEDNAIERTGNAAVFVGCCEQVRVRGNRLEQCCCRPSRIEAGGVFFLRNCAHVRLEGNAITGPERQGQPVHGVVAEENVKLGTIALENNQGFEQVVILDRENHTRHA